MNILVTGAAGFIGYHLCEKLLALGHTVIGLDNINNYYDINLKLDRLKQLGVFDVKEGVLVKSQINENFKFIKINLENREALSEVFKENNLDAVCNLAAQAGVRYSIENPFAYVESNIVGFLNVLENCRTYNVKKLVYASSSSVYGLNEKIPFSVEDNVDSPISIYAATKKSNELMAHTYSHLFGIQTTGLRFFTVYGPWGRPDMAMFLFTDAILHDKPIKVFNEGNLSRDFTYIDDIITGVTATLLNNKEDKESLFKIYNIGNSKPVRLLDFITEIEKYTDKTAIKNMLPMQPGDVEKTWADVSALEKDFGYRSLTDITTGVHNFIDWYRGYYKV
ncbi:NAD-dependent epimerase [Flavobacterium sp. NRK1]|uniref:NAD-dependent epimerase n=1 Tax=Flavobacterium sp. NRK1 TaxID=2954929 RepID=UPI00209389DE|nr:NAD-dependent epimerase [Flavobacterium sp. NRK1]MCO6146899.1 NAD-dependent epimerase [Flavobacterium sp. NRK1]